MKIVQYLKILFLILSLVVLSFIIPIGTALYLGEHALLPAFLLPAAVVLVLSAVLFFVGKGCSLRFSTRGGVLLVAAAWTFSGILGAVPFFLSGAIPNFADALFESVSGFTTTGATIVTDLEAFPVSLHVWRAQMHWLGGMGIVALTVALFSLLGVGGFRLIKSEKTGPDRGKITPKIAHTAKALWFIYIGMTLVEMLLLKIAGMDVIDAMCHSFATVGTGGFSLKTANIGAYNSLWIDSIIIVFMVLAGINFSLYYGIFSGNVKAFFKNSELRSYLKILLGASIIVIIAIIPVYGVKNSFRHGIFQVVSIMTTTGFRTVDFDQWPALAKMVLFALMFVGGCSGSTAGGIKVVRWVILRRQAQNEMKRLLHPHGIFSIHLDGRPGRKDFVYSVAGFLFLYAIVVLFTALVAVAGGANIVSGFSTALALVGNIGPGFDMIGPAHNFAFFADWAKILFSFSMLAGRLELYTMIIIFTSFFWRK